MGRSRLNVHMRAAVNIDLLLRKVIVFISDEKQPFQCPYDGCNYRSVLLKVLLLHIIVLKEVVRSHSSVHMMVVDINLLERIIDHLTNFYLASYTHW